MNRGFSLVELLVVLSIIGVLAAVVTASMGAAREQGRDATRRTDIEQLGVALSLYRNQNIAYPSDQAAFASVIPDYINTWPTDPATDSDYTYVSNGQQFKIYAVLEGEVAGDDPMIACPNQCDGPSDCDGIPNNAIAVYSQGGQCL